MTSIVHAQNITHRYGERVALDGFSLDVPTGATFGLLGPNGSGKSTFISLVAAMEQPQAGELRVFGSAPAAALRGRVGTVFQENAQDPLMTVGETLTLAGRLFGLTQAQVTARAADLLERFGLTARLDDAISTLSGGMRRRLEMARALLHDPPLLLLDEPTTGVDPGERRALWDTLRASSASSNGGTPRTILLASNDLAEADSVCDLVAFMDGGRVSAMGTPGELKRGLRRESVRVTWPGVSDGDVQAITTWEGTGAVIRDGDDLHLTADDASALVPRLFELGPSAIRGVQIEPATLEDAYFQHVRGRERARGEEVHA